MNSTLKHYLQATKALLKEGASLDSILSGLKSTLDKRGHIKLYPNLLRSLLRSLEEDSSTGAPVLVVAKEADAKHFLKDAPATTRVVVDENIVGGHILTEDWKRTDSSYKTQLLTWYRRSLKQ